MKTVLVLMSLFGAAPRGEVLELTGEHCVWCRNVAPTVLRLQREGLPIRQINVDQNQQEAKQYGCSGLPTFLIVVDGKVMERHEGAMSEDALRQMVARIPAAPPASPNPSSPNLRIELGEPTPMPRPAAGQGTIAESEIKTASAEESSMIPKIFRRQPKPEPQVRGQSGDLAADAEQSGELAMAASVRLNLIQNGKMLQGSGTIIDSRVGRTVVVTSGAPFTKLPAGSKIEVEVRGGSSESKTRKFVAKLLASDPKADVALVEFPTDQPLATAPIALVTPKLNERLASIGGAAGGAITREQVRVTAINKYEGPDTIECSGVPLPGRSGCGLFNAGGELSGICVAVSEDSISKAPTGGLYCGLKPIHDLLRAQNLGALIEPPGVTPAGDVAGMPATAPGMARPMPANAQTPAVQPAAMDEFAALASAAMPATQPVASISDDSPVGLDDDQEVIVIMRSKKSGSTTRVIHIHKASPTLRSILDGAGELNGPAITSRPQPARSTTSVASALTPLAAK